MTMTDERLERARKQESKIAVWDLDSMEDSVCARTNWILCEECGVPELGVYVLGRHNRGTWLDSSDPDGVNYIWVKRALDENYELNPNNKKHYVWKSFGPDLFFGQTITHWCFVNRLKVIEG